MLYEQTYKWKLVPLQQNKREIERQTTLCVAVVSSTHEHLDKSIEMKWQTEKSIKWLYNVDDGHSFILFT
jgi:hypothetical protein